MKFQFIGRPRIGRLEQITKWLKEELTNTGSGFYCNISVINKAFHDNEAFCVTFRNQAVAFSIFTRHRNTARIEIAEVCPSLRGTGAGRFLIEKTLESLAKRKVQVVDLQCEPRESEGFWKHMGFCNVPDGIDENHYSPYNKPIVMYQPTCSVQHEVPFNTAENVIELFDCKQWECDGRQPKWCWPLVTDNGSNVLRNPIIHPVNRDWYIRWKNKGKILKEVKVKYFIRDNYPAGSYFILQKLPEQ